MLADDNISSQYFLCHTEPQQFKVIKLNSKLKRHN